MSTFTDKKAFVGATPLVQLLKGLTDEVPSARAGNDQVALLDAVHALSMAKTWRGIGSFLYTPGYLAGSKLMDWTKGNQEILPWNAITILGDRLERLYTMCQSYRDEDVSLMNDVDVNERLRMAASAMQVVLARFLLMLHKRDVAAYGRFVQAMTT
jgi:hypothetical protein